MSLLELSSKANKKKRNRLGRGNGSCHGTYCGRGGKGQTARTGANIRPGFEGGQTPILRKMPKLKGFRNPNHIEYLAINVGQLNVFEENSTVKREDFLKRNLIPKKSLPIKLLGGKGPLEKKLTIVVDKASKEAIKIVENAKGKVELGK